MAEDEIEPTECKKKQTGPYKVLALCIFFCRIKMCISQLSILQKCIGVESIESTRSCSKAN